MSAVALVMGLALMLLTPSLAWEIVGAAAVALSWLAPVLYAVRFRTRAELRKMATGDDIRAAQRAITTSVGQTQKSLSRTESQHSRSLQRIEEQLRKLTVLGEAEAFHVGDPGIDILFATSNGAGLGHLSRLLAIAHQLSEATTYEFLTLSTAYPRVARDGLTIHYFPSSEASAQSSAVWNQHFRAYLLRLVETSRPRVVVFDGTWVYAALTDICRAHGIPLVWVQRGMWKAEIDASSTQRHDAGRVADHVIVPGDFAGDEKVDAGKKIAARYVGPIVMTSRTDLLPRQEACVKLGLDPSERYVLFNFGGGSISDPASLAYTCRELLSELAPELTPVQVVSPLSESDDDVPGVVRVSSFPVMPAVRAFEFMISASGYNSAQEAICLGVPAILVPNAETRTDDQTRRARLLAERGLCLLAEEVADMRSALAKIVDAELRNELRQRLEQIESPRGGLEAAKILEFVVAQAEWPTGATTLKGSTGSDV